MTGEELADVVRAYLSASNEWAKQERAGICAERLRASSALLEARMALECAVETFAPCHPNDGRSNSSLGLLEDSMSGNLKEVVHEFLVATDEFNAAWERKQWTSGYVHDAVRRQNAAVQLRQARCSLDNALAETEQPVALRRKASPMPDQEFLDKAAIAAMQGTLSIEMAQNLDSALVATWSWDVAEALHHERSVRAEQRSKT